MKKYYIIKHLPAEPQDMVDGPRIVCTNHDIIKIIYDEGEGPFPDISSLKRDSSIYKMLQKNDHKRAEKIVQKKFIVEPTETIMFPVGLDDDFINNIYKILHHSKIGIVQPRNVRGIHIFDEDKIRIDKLLYNNEVTGVFEAEISVKNLNTGQFIKKEGKTTFFPKAWNLQKLIIECYYAYKNKVEIDSNIYHGITSSGIKLEFRISASGEIITVYPINDYA